MQQTLLVLVNVPDESIAHTMARSLLEQRLAACVNLLLPVHSLYRWQGKIEEATEVTMLVKTTQGRYAELETAVKACHPYEVPEIIALPIASGLPEYLGWVIAETKKDTNA